jgi:hypothetical protein
MSAQSSPGALGASHAFLRLLIVVNLLMGVVLLALLVYSVIDPGLMWRALVGFPAERIPSLAFGLRTIVVLGIAAVPITHTVLTRLLAIVDTVRVGDPFVVENALRLQRIAWAVLALELLHLVVVAVARSVSTPEVPIDISWNLSVTRWLAVLLLFVLARVFETGTRMRDELEATV